MSHINRISNGRFEGDLANWTVAGSAIYIVNQGNDELGACHLTIAGDKIDQVFSVQTTREWMVELAAIQASSTGTVTVNILDDSSNTVYTATAAAGAAWAVDSNRVGLVAGINYTLEIVFNDVAAYIDDISVAIVLSTRLELADEVHDLLGDLATADAAFSTTPSGDDTEGDYTEAVSFGLREVTAVNESGNPDVRYLMLDEIDACIDEIQKRMLHKLHRYYARNATDFTLEGRTESHHQRVSAIENLLGISVGGRPSGAGRSVQTRRLIHGRKL